MRLVLVAIAILPLAVAQRQCYYPNGERDPNGRPCGEDGGGSDVVACCYGSHYCLDNGLCLAKDSLTMYRSSCTDSTFESDKCGQFCTGGRQGGVDYSHSGVWTCGDDLFSCHSAGCSIFNFTVPGAKVVYNAALAADVTALAVSASESGSITTVTTTETVTATTTPDESGGVSTATAAGIGAGVGVPLLVAAASLLFLLLRERKKRLAYQDQLRQYGIAASYPPANAPGGQYYPVIGGAEQGDKSTQPPSELRGTQRYELQT